MMDQEPDGLFPFPLDDFQKEAIRSLQHGKSVIVCAPTGAGKTVVAEYAVKQALARGKRCFFTTPLKALSNQKFGDLRREYGEENVGLLTGDTSFQRHAPIIVMTTEVYRNMLYGTVLGDVQSNLAHVESVILDECHYMNDPERGTVWEESVIYSPPPVQLVALSATVANAADLRDWFEAIHGPTDLVLSDFRPVPLRHHYYHEGDLHRLVMGNGRLNPRLAAQDRPIPQVFNRGRGRSRAPRPRQDYPEKVVSVLDREGMLPAIFFLFSRKKCDEAARRSDLAVHLTPEHRQALQEAIDQALRETPSLADHPQLEHLRNGVAAHHAGLLPTWKTLVESLFQQGLIQVVYATETLAAGINMPARTTVISAISKYSDEGHRMLTASEFLQMSGRAGRRGMDVLGHVVVVHHPLEPVEDAARLAIAPADPLVSRFTPSYGMVLNLLQRHSLEESRRLVDRSFGQFMAEREKGPLFEEAARLHRQLKDLSRPLCPGPIGDLPAWKKLREKARSLARQAKTMAAGLKGCTDPVARQALEDLRNRQVQASESARTMPCQGCPVQSECSRQIQSWRNRDRRREEIERALKRASTPYWKQFQDLERVLRAAGYLEGHEPTWEGRMAASLRATNILFLGEVALSGILETLEPVEVAGLMSALVAGDTRAVPDIGMRVSRHAEEALTEIVGISRDVHRLQERYGVDVPVLVNPVFAGLTEFWARGADWPHVKAYLGVDEGDMVRSLRRTLDLCRQFAFAPHMPERIATLCHEAAALMDRDEVHESLFWSS
ncbi:MAG: DEAD/DEAH box helicase [Candidatus Xenobium sp.]|jgi:superfamily II RNA helicase|nr:DEAD/DEAH box helicase [Burkholderiales bacterium]